MNPRKRIYDLIKRAERNTVELLRPWAFPAHGMRLPPILVFAQLKSGSVYIQRALRRTLQVEVRHISGSGTSGVWLSYPALIAFAKGNAVSREHLQPRPEIPAILADFGVSRAVVHVRDPRAAVVSWTRQMDRNLPERGLRYVAFSCEQEVPEAYLRWTFAERLRWQVEHFMPRMVDWTEGWVDIADRSRKVNFLVTDHAELARDTRAFIEKILKFHEIPYREEWLRIPAMRIGKNNIFSPEQVDDDSLPPSSQPAWLQQMDTETLELANAKLPPRLCERFGWTQSL